MWVPSGVGADFPSSRRSRCHSSEVVSYCFYTQAQELWKGTALARETITKLIDDMDGTVANRDGDVWARRLPVPDRFVGEEREETHAPSSHHTSSVVTALPAVQPPPFGAAAGVGPPPATRTRTRPSANGRRARAWTSPCVAASARTSSTSTTRARAGSGPHLPGSGRSALGRITRTVAVQLRRVLGLCGVSAEAVRRRRKIPVDPVRTSRSEQEDQRDQRQPDRDPRPARNADPRRCPGQSRRRGGPGPRRLRRRT